MTRLTSNRQAVAASLLDSAGHPARFPQHQFNFLEHGIRYLVDINVTLKVPALEKLVQVTASGIGAVAGSMLGPWKTTRDAKAKLIEAKAQASSLQVIAQAQADARQTLITSDAVTGILEITQEQITQRLEFQEHKRQQNIAAVVRRTADELGDEEVPDTEPDHDWTARFFEYVQDVSEEDVRKIWSRILAGDVRLPGQVSLRTLSTLRNMSRQEAELFTEAMRYRIDDYILKKECLKSSEILKSNHFDFLFVDMGLFFSTVLTRPPRHISLDENGDAHLVNADHLLFLKGNPKNSIDRNDDKVVLKRPAIELSPFCNASSSPTYLRHIASRLAKHNCTLKAAPIEKTTADGHQYSHHRVRIIEPF